MKDMDYSSKEGCHYSLPSMYGKDVKEQNAMQPKYEEPGKADGQMKGAHSNPQKGP